MELAVSRHRCQNLQSKELFVLYQERKESVNSIYFLVGRIEYETQFRIAYGKVNLTHFAHFSRLFCPYFPDLLYSVMSGEFRLQ